VLFVIYQCFHIKKNQEKKIQTVVHKYKEENRSKYPKYGWKITANQAIQTNCPMLLY